MRQVAFGRGLRVGVAGIICCALANCSSDTVLGKLDPRYGVSSSPRLVGPGEPVPKGGGVYRIGAPYVVGGRTYIPEDDPNYSAEGLASWYGDDFHGRATANGEVYDMQGISAAHPTLPLPSYARVTNLGNGRSLIVRVNDRGPYHANRIIDVSAKAARLLDFHGDGVARVRVEYVSRAPLEGSDDGVLLATLREGKPAPAPSAILLASAKPFLPQLGSRVPAVHGPVPLPPDRPYDLGGDQQGASGARTGRQAALRLGRDRDAGTRIAADRLPPIIADGPANSPPLAAFAPSPVMSGRGLY